MRRVSFHVALTALLLSTGVGAQQATRAAQPAAAGAPAVHDARAFFTTTSYGLGRRPGLVGGRSRAFGVVRRDRHLQRLRPERRRPQAPAHDVDDRLDLRRLVVPARRPHPVQRGQGRQRARSPLRARAGRHDARPDAGRESEGRLRRLVGRPQRVLRQHQRARSEGLRPLSLCHDGLPADAGVPATIRRSASPRCRPTAVTSRWSSRGRAPTPTCTCWTPASRAPPRPSSPNMKATSATAPSVSRPTASGSSTPPTSMGSSRRPGPTTWRTVPRRRWSRRGGT